VPLTTENAWGLLGGPEAKEAEKKAMAKTQWVRVIGNTICDGADFKIGEEHELSVPMAGLLKSSSKVEFIDGPTPKPEPKGAKKDKE
jgi:hypothetical protein